MNWITVARGFAALLLPVAVSAAETPHATVELVSQYEAAAPGTEQWIGIHFKPHDGWHVYWKNPGDSGLPPRGEFSAVPEGSKFGPLEFPTPDRIPYGPLVNFAYEGEVLYPVRWTTSASAAIGESTVLTANLKWLICKEECVPGKATLTLKLPVVSTETFRASAGTHTRLFASTVAALARDSGERIRLALSPAGDRIEIAFHGPEAKGLSKGGLRSVFFFPEGEYGIGADAKQVATATADGFTLVVPRKDPKPVGEIRGVLKISEGKSYQVAEVIDPKLLAAAKPSAPVASPAAPATLPLMLLFAFLGGLILNLMPCILPVLSIKVLGLANQAGANRAEVRRHGFVFTFGILVSFWALAAILIAVRSSGQTLGWGFQLQNPIFVASLAVLFFLMALNLFGVFEIGDRWIGAGSGLAAKEGYAGSFFTGVLTTIAATPCSAPFMGSALGFALTQSAGVAFLVLTVLALGLAFPYLLFSLLPSASRMLPRPGAWMKTLKELLAFPLLATVIWLASVIGNQTGETGVILLLTVLTLTLAVVWLVGRRPVGNLALVTKWACVILAAAAAVSSLRSLAAMQKTEVASRPAGGSPLVHAPWKEWSPEAEARARAAGKTVLINFTAEWCVTCKVNESVVFNRDVVRAALAQDSVEALLADWTNSDAAITAALAQVARNSVPVYLLYRPGAAAPQVLPQILTVEGLLKNLSSD